MSNTNNAILRFAEHLAGEAADQTVLSAMCEAAAEEIEGRLKEGVSLSDLGSTYVIAAGVLALSLYCAAGDPGQLTGFRAGEVSAQYCPADADSLRCAAERMLADKLRDRGFGFLGVQG